MNRTNYVVIRIAERITKGTADQPMVDKHGNVNVHADLVAGTAESGCLFITGTIAKNEGLAKNQVWLALAESEDTPADSEYQRNHSLTPIQLLTGAELRECLREFGIAKVLEKGAPGTKKEYAKWLKSEAGQKSAVTETSDSM